MSGRLLLRATGAIHVLVVALVFSGCAWSPEAKSAKHIEAGKKLLLKNDVARAILEFRTATQATPKEAEAYYQLSLAYLAAHDLPRGASNLRKTLELNPKHAGAQLRLAELMAGTSDPGMLMDARRRLQALLQETPENAETLHALALTELKLGETESAMQHLERAMTAGPQEILPAVTLAETKLRQGDLKGAEDVLKRACENSPKSDDARVILGGLYAAENKLAESEQQYRAALAINPNSSAALLNLGRLQNSAGRKQDAEKTFKRLGELPDKTVKHYHAVFLFQEGRRDEAVREFAALAKQDPDDRMARTRLVTAYQNMNRAQDALDVLNGALKKNPKDLEALLQRGEISVGSSKYADAESDFNRVLHLKPDAPEVHYALARLYQKRGATLRQRQELSEVLRLNPLLLQVRVELAKSWIGDNSAESAKGALSLLDATPEDQKNQIVVNEQRNWALISAGRFGEARKGVEQGLASSRTADLLLQEAILNVASGRYSEAQKSVREELAKNPEDLRGLRVLVSSYAAQKQVPAAVAQVRAHAAQNPKSAPIQYFLGNLLLETGDRVQARQAFTAAKAINPEYTPADLSLARIDLTQANWNDARQQLTTILAKKGDNFLALKWLGMLEIASGNQAAAIADFRKLVEVQPNDGIALNNLAYLLVETGKMDEALKYAQRAQELVPDNPDVEDTLGWVLYQKGLYGNAVTHLQSAVSKGGGARQQYHLAMACFKSGDESRGHAILTAALRKDPSLPEAQLAQQAAREAKPGR